MSTGDKLGQLKNREQELLKMNQDVDKKRKSIQENAQLKRGGTKTPKEQINQNYSDEESKQSSQRKHPSLHGGENIDERDLIDKIQDIKRKNEIDLIQKIAKLKQISAEQEEEIEREKQSLIEKEHKANELGDNLIQVETQIKELEGKGKQLSENQKLFVNQIQQITEKYEAVKQQMKDSKYKFEVAQRDKQLMQKEFEEQSDNSIKIETSSLKKDAKIQKLTADVEALKIESKEKNIVQREVSDDLKKQNDKLLIEQKRLERQKQELIQAFKKQLKLIELLKKQKTHLEIARSLNLTEEEYIKAVDLGEKL